MNTARGRVGVGVGVAVGEAERVAVRDGVAWDAGVAVGAATALPGVAETLWFGRTCHQAATISPAVTNESNTMPTVFSRWSQITAAIVPGPRMPSDVEAPGSLPHER